MVDHVTNEFRQTHGRPAVPAMLRGLRCRCPNCGEGRLFRAFLKTHDACPVCHEELHHQRADDFPAYIVVLIVGHIVVGAFMGFELMFELSTWQHLAIWIPVTIIAAVALIQPIKGAVIGLQWALRMHGFGGIEDRPEEH
ncbi:MAG: DUF983 domain-containing protein [Rhizobiaceae bacterium]|nr:DUF983 domain-containing protein [Rhizobiaceae bacterium]